MPGLRKLADEHELLLIFDEVQSGCGRTGKWFAYEHSGVTPDIMTLAKSLCGGIAGAAMLTTAEIAPSLRPGMHAATFGGNPIAARAGIATIETIEEDGLLERADAARRAFRERLAAAGRRAGDRRRTARVRPDDRPGAGRRRRADRPAMPGARPVDQLHAANGASACLPAMTLTDEQLRRRLRYLADVLRARSMEHGVGSR